MEKRAHQYSTAHQWERKEHIISLFRFIIITCLLSVLSTCLHYDFFLRWMVVPLFCKLNALLIKVIKQFVIWSIDYGGADAWFTNNFYFFLCLSYYRINTTTIILVPLYFFFCFSCWISTLYRIIIYFIHLLYIHFFNYLFSFISQGTETAESLKSKVQALEGVTFVKAVDLFRTGFAGPYTAISSKPAEKKANTEVC